MFTQRGVNALMHASHSGSVDILEALIKHPEVDLNERSDVCSLLEVMSLFDGH